MPFAYLLRCRDGTLYAGAAKDLDRRLREHRAGRASRYTRSRLPVVLVWFAEQPTWSAALREEARIKRLPRTAKLALIRESRPPRRRGVELSSPGRPRKRRLPRVPAAPDPPPPSAGESPRRAPGGAGKRGARGR